jgi:transcriptional regulator with XRE-family HTH domain
VTIEKRRSAVHSCATPNCACKEFAVRLLRRMNERRMRASHLAKAAGFPASRVSHYVNGESLPDYHGMIAIARALNVSVDYLMTGAAPNGLIPAFEGGRT